MLFPKQPLINPRTSNWFGFAGLVWWIHYARVGPLLFGWELSLTFSDLLIIIAWHATHLQLFSGTLLKKRISFFCLNGIAYFSNLNGIAYIFYFIFMISIDNFVCVFFCFCIYIHFIGFLTSYLNIGNENFNFLSLNMPSLIEARSWRYLLKCW